MDVLRIAGMGPHMYLHKCTLSTFLVRNLQVGSLDWNGAPLLTTSCHKARDERSKIHSYRYIGHTNPETVQVHQPSKSNTMGHPRPPIAFCHAQNAQGEPPVKVMR